MTPKTPKLILASQSPRRRELLQSRGLEFDIQPASVEESIDTHQGPENNVLSIARSKAEAVHRMNPDCFVLGADTIVVLENVIIGKPRDREDAVRILTRLSGKDHQVMTAAVIIDPSGKHRETVVTSTVTIKTLTQGEMMDYIQTGEPMDKAGAYAIQGQGSALVKSWSGSYSNIVGLPVDPVLDMLIQAGFPLPPAPKPSS